MSERLAAYRQVRRHSERICRPLRVEDYVPQPATFVSPPKWHLGHTTWFFEAMLLQPFLPGYRPFHPRYAFVFNSYYESLGERQHRARRGDLSRPTVAEVMDYRRYVDARMEELFFLPDLPEQAWQLLELGMQHEQQHQELLYTDLKYILSLNPLQPLYDERSFCLSEERQVLSWVSMPEGQYPIGFRGEGFCYDNELAPHQVLLPAYEIASRLVTNGEYLAFMEEGGYRRHEFWHSEGWEWVKAHDRQAPLYWFKEDDRYWQYTLSGLQPVGEGEVLTHVNHFEAFAFAQWKGCRLPTEFEWEAAQSYFSWGLRWEHTASAYLPYPGYRRPEGAVGEYNGKFMVNQQVLRGASVATPAGHSRYSYRNFFHADEQWQYTGIRLARDPS